MAITTARRFRALLLPAVALSFIAVGFLIGQSSPTTGHRVWQIGLILTGLPLLFRTLRAILKAQFATDVVATLAILTAILLGTPFPGLVVVLMQTGGEALERYAEGRASDAVRELEARAPVIAHRLTNDAVRDIPVIEIVPGDTLLVRPGELLPCDAVVLDGVSSVDASRLTGEALPVEARVGIHLMSGSGNLTSPLTIRALASARESQYARIVDLVRSAQGSKAPFQRMADRYASWFTPVTMTTSALAYLISGDWHRVLAVLVVATPCPLILAAPVAIIGGINRAARRMIIFRTGSSVEKLGTVTAAIFDKTGTLTIGRPQVTRVIPAQQFDPREILRLAGAVEQYAGHPMARTLNEKAGEWHLTLPSATQVEEAPGQGVEGVVEGRLVTVGGRSWVLGQYPETAPDFDRLVEHAVGLRALVAVNGKAAGVVVYEDRIRPGVGAFMGQLKQLGLAPLVLLSGDHELNATEVARSAGMDSAEGDLLPADKSRRVAALMRAGHSVVMLGDGTNDAPALSTASVGVALASGGGGISSEAADVVLLADDPTLLVDAIRISRATLRIARQSVTIGLGLSLIAMGFATAGMIPPTIGALLQEVIDVAVILNALRARGEPAARSFGLTSAPGDSLRRIALLLALSLATAAPLTGQAKDSVALRTRRPPQVTDSAVARGREVFHGPGKCSVCHGLEGIGTDSGAPLAQGVWLHGKDSYQGIFSRVVHGIPGEVSTRGTAMPIGGGGALSNQQVADVAAYVWSISHGWIRGLRKRTGEP